MTLVGLWGVVQGQVQLVTKRHQQLHGCYAIHLTCEECAEMSQSSNSAKGKKRHFLADDGGARTDRAAPEDRARLRGHLVDANCREAEVAAGVRAGVLLEVLAASKDEVVHPRPPVKSK